MHKQTICIHKTNENIKKRTPIGIRIKPSIFPYVGITHIRFGQGITDGLFGWGLTPVMLIACILLDYVLAYTSLGIAGIFRNKGAAGWLGGTILAVFIRFLFHFLSGVVIWHSYGELWNGFSTDNTVLYSLLYNGSYMLPEMIFTGIGAYVLFKVPQTRKLLKGDISETEKAE